MMKKLDFRRFKLDEKYAQHQGEQRTLAVKARRPRSDEWFTVHPDPEFSQETNALIVAADFSYYLVDPSIVPQLEGADYKVMNLHTAITARGSIFMLTVGTGSDGFSESLRAAVEQAKEGYVRVASNTAERQYDAFLPKKEIPPPVWPADLTFDGVMEMAFKDRVIDSVNHPVIKGLHGDF